MPSPYSYAEYGEKGSGDTIVVPFPFLSRDHVYVVVDDEDVSSALYSWTNDGLITCGSGFPEGEVTRVERRTPIEDPEAVQTGGGVFDYEAVNENDLQVIYALQELADAEADRNARVEDMEDAFDTVDESAVAAAASALAAATSETNAEADRVATAVDRVQTGLDRVATGNDAVATAADRVQTGLDVIAAADSAATAATLIGGTVTAALRHDTAQGLNDTQQQKALENAGVSSFLRGIRGSTDAAAVRTAIGAQPVVGPRWHINRQGSASQAIADDTVTELTLTNGDTPYTYLTGVTYISGSTVEIIRPGLYLLYAQTVYDSTVNTASIYIRETTVGVNLSIGTEPALNRRCPLTITIKHLSAGERVCARTHQQSSVSRNASSLRELTYFGGIFLGD